MKTRFVWLIAGPLVGILAFHEYRAQTDEVALLRHELAALRAQQDRLAAQALRPPVVVQATAAPAGAAPAVEGSPAAAEAAPAARPPAGDAVESEAARTRRWDNEARAHQAAVEQAFADQARDESWAAGTRTSLGERLGAVSRSLGSSLRDIECRSTMCRVEMQYRDADASRQFVALAFTAPEDRAWNGPVLYMPARTGSDGSLAVVMYLAREGTAKQEL